jgi:hypothetical protein
MSISYQRFFDSSYLISEMGYIFSEGNLPSTHSSFPSQHLCNHFCKFFQLQAFPDYEVEDGELPEAGN